MATVLLVGNSKNVRLPKFDTRLSGVKFDHVCRFNYGWAHRDFGEFDCLISSNYSHDRSVAELRQCGKLSAVKKIYLVCPNIQEKKYSVDPCEAPYEEILDHEFAIIHNVLHRYGFPPEYVPRTGITSIIYFAVIKKYKVYLCGMDTKGVDDPNDQSAYTPNHRIDPSHSIKAEAELYTKLLADKVCELCV